MKGNTCVITGATSGIGRAAAGFANWICHLGYHALKRDLVSPGKGAETIVYLATSPEAEGVSGKYFHRNREAPSSGISGDADAARRLCELSLRLAGLDERTAPLRDLLEP